MALTSTVTERPRILNQSKDLLSRALKVIPSATQTFSKGPSQWAGGVSPYYLSRGDGAWVWDVDGNKYLDFLMALGPIILGYNNPTVNRAVIRALHDGVVFSQMHPLEVEVAELLVDIIPCAEMVRFAKNGSDATTAAIRAARALTGRDRVACCGYHGWHDWYIGSTTRNKGVPRAIAELTHSFLYNDIASLERIFDQYPGEIAAVILEPVGVVPPQAGFLERVREITRSHNAVLIFDEIVTGFRLSLGGAQQYYGISPDMACFGKAMANGMPLSAVVGQKHAMEVFDEIFFSGTLGGETASLAACKATIEQITLGNVIPQIWHTGAKLLEGLQNLISQYGLGRVVQTHGLAPRSILAFPHANERQSRVRRSFFMQECVKRGLLYYCSHVPCAAHGDAEIDFALGVFREVMPTFAAAYQADDFEDRLEGECIEPIFRKA